MGLWFIVSIIITSPISSGPLAVHPTHILNWLSIMLRYTFTASNKDRLNLNYSVFIFVPYREHLTHIYRPDLHAVFLAYLLNSCYHCWAKEVDFFHFLYFALSPLGNQCLFHLYHRWPLELP